MCVIDIFIWNNANYMEKQANFEEFGSDCKLHENYKIWKVPRTLLDL